MKNYDLVIIGGGSAGVASAISAYDNGVKSILIVEKEAYLGGILLQCIHNGFGLHTFKEELTGPEYANRFEKEVLKRNIECKLNSCVLSLDKTNDGFLVIYSNEAEGLVRVHAKSVVLSTGCTERTRGAIAIDGDRCSGVMTAGMAQKYLNIEGYMVGKKVFILGSGDIGLIMARRMKLEGADVIGVAEIMPYSNGLNRNIVQCLEDFNIPLYLHHTVKKTIGKTRLEKIVLVEVDDNLNYIEETCQEIEVDTLLLSIGLIPSNPLLENLNVKLHPKTKGPLVDESYQTSIEGIFACGNSLHVHDLVDYVTLEGIKVGESVAKYLNGKLNKGTSIEVINGKGISYVLPQRVNLTNIEKVRISFRVTTPHQNCYINIYQGDELIKKIKKQYLIPAEMENLNIDKSIILNNNAITLEVEDA